MVANNHIGDKWLIRTFAIVAAGVIATAAAVLASPVVMPRIIRSHPDWLKRGAFRRYADFRRKRAGRAAFRHRASDPRRASQRTHLPDTGGGFPLP